MSQALGSPLWTADMWFCAGARCLMLIDSSRAWQEIEDGRSAGRPLYV